MEIDIITLTDKQFSQLTEDQIQEIKNTQLKKNSLKNKLEEDKNNEKYRLLSRGIFRSSVYEKVCEKLDEKYDSEVEALKDALLFYLKFTVKPDVVDAPYRYDLSLSYTERFEIVKNYYMNNFSSLSEALARLTNDDIALSYLGEYYGYLYEYIAARM